MTQQIDLLAVDPRHNRHARATAQQQVSWPLNLAPATVTYHSDGHALILGNEHDVRRAACALLALDLPAPTLLFTDSIAGMGDAIAGDELDTLLADTDSLTCHALTRTQAQSLRLSGYLGHFSATLLDEGQPLELARALANRTHFDLIVDLGEVPTLPLELPPPGYLAMHWGSPDCEARLETLAGLVGDFDKPRYFDIDPGRCAHAASGNLGCTRCLEVCPADAVTSRQGRIEAWIEIDPFRCHGVGSCSSACPTGAIQFRLPETRRQQDAVLAWLEAYRDAGGTAPVVRFVEVGDLASEADAAGHVLDIPLEELGAAGHDQWLTALAGGAAEVRVQCRPGMPDRLTAFIDDQLAQAHALLRALGHSPSRVTRLMSGDESARDALPCQAPLEGVPLALTEHDKRDRLNSVLAHLERLGNPDGQRHAMPAGAAYGGLAVNAEACTLCLACVSNCPTPALAAGNDRPMLSLREADCVQCGLCAEACPENAITLVPGFLAEPTRRERKVQHEEAAFPCIRCGKPFATASAVATIKAKLADHPYFAGDALTRLEMCEDCRVKDVWQAMARDPESQLKV